MKIMSISVERRRLTFTATLDGPAGSLFWPQMADRWAVSLSLELGSGVASLSSASIASPKVALVDLTSKDAENSLRKAPISLELS
jgi:hypothetical protein